MKEYGRETMEKLYINAAYKSYKCKVPIWAFLKM